MRALIINFLLLIFCRFLIAQTFPEFKVKTFFHCVNGKIQIEKELSKIEGITYVNADINTKIVTVKYDKAKCDTNKIINEIERIGYYTQYSDKKKRIKRACPHDSKKAE
ncbi:MAG: cation transporter [Bacteroidales bacterium]|nr:cation transporter [Bacteroidales bacterium]